MKVFSVLLLLLNVALRIAPEVDLGVGVHELGHDGSLCAVALLLEKQSDKNSWFIKVNRFLKRRISKSKNSTVVRLFPLRYGGTFLKPEPK